ncbi:hypothetical protein IVB30_00735 [Bradyrhizobium sp. 200]|uniref:hypothetical protein n=1 Tax=Bradyrhizobium sp. 200 TaxID=2782665 RepID=UPI001FFF551D|nr:hypothetical protein [Bradyrhizobium sp. 200]UPJ50000.1 hypothetical protein IVB30_00735 [Bradyrhizobium sp. 200]
MNGLDALAAAKKGDGIVRVPSWQAEAGLAANHLVRQLTEDQGVRRLSRRALARH